MSDKKIQMVRNKRSTIRWQLSSRQNVVMATLTTKPLIAVRNSKAK
jgi:hypothetical protein